MGDEQPADEPGERGAVPRRQAVEHRQDVGPEAGRGLGYERPAVAGEADKHRPPVRRRGDAHDQAAALRAVDQARINAAVVTSFAEAPHYRQFEVPCPRSADEALVEVLAVGLHPRVRTGAAGGHYTSTGTLLMMLSAASWPPGNHPAAPRS